MARLIWPPLLRLTMHPSSQTIIKFCEKLFELRNFFSVDFKSTSEMPFLSTFEMSFLLSSIFRGTTLTWKAYVSYKSLSRFLKIKYRQFFKSVVHSKKFNNFGKWKKFMESIHCNKKNITNLSIYKFVKWNRKIKRITQKV
jgi:hypothetical protein